MIPFKLWQVRLYFRSPAELRGGSASIQRGLTMSFDIDDEDRYARAPKLPLWATIRQSYASYFAHL
jgi:hypothetical protein